MSEKKAIRQYREPAGGWGALRATGKALTEQGIAISGSATLLRMNQPEGFDCPGCAWPDPKHTSSFEFCENGAKAVAWEATAKRCTPEFFAAHTVAELDNWDDFDLEMQGRLTHPMMYDATTDHYVPIEWDNAFALVAQHLRALPTPNAADFYVSGRASNEAAFLYQLFAREYGTNNFPDCSNMCHEATSVGLPEFHRRRQRHSPAGGFRPRRRDLYFRPEPRNQQPADDDEPAQRISSWRPHHLIQSVP